MRDNNKSDKSSANFNSNFLYIFHFKFFLHSEKMVPNFAANSSLINSPVITSLGLRNKFAARRRVAFSLSLSQGKPPGWKARTVRFLTIDASRLGTDSRPDERICTSRVPSSTHSSTQPRVSLPGSGQRERVSSSAETVLA